MILTYILAWPPDDHCHTAENGPSTQEEEEEEEEEEDDEEEVAEAAAPPKKKTPVVEEEEEEIYKEHVNVIFIGHVGKFGKSWTGLKFHFFLRGTHF